MHIRLHALLLIYVSLNSGTDVRIGQIGHGLGPRAFGDPRNHLFYDDSMLAKNLQNCAEA